MIWMRIEVTRAEMRAKPKKATRQRPPKATAQRMQAQAVEAVVRKRMLVEEEAVEAVVRKRMLVEARVEGAMVLLQLPQGRSPRGRERTRLRDLHRYYHWELVFSFCVCVFGG